MQTAVPALIEYLRQELDTIEKVIATDTEALELMRASERELLIAHTEVRGCDAAACDTREELELLLFAMVTAADCRQVVLDVLDSERLILVTELQAAQALLA